MAQIRAFSVHVFTALGAALALAALIFAVRRDWPAMFLCLGIALIVDGVDGTLARSLRVNVLLPRWSGDVLDLVVDYTTYVFVPAYAIAAGGLMPEPIAIMAGMIVVVTGALYFADTAMKTDDNYFRGFPTLWNAVAFYLFVLKLPSALAATVVIVLAVATFLPFKFLHPMRVRRLRRLNVAAVVAWSALALTAVLANLDPGPWVTGGLVLIAVYLVGVGLTEKR